MSLLQRFKQKGSVGDNKSNQKGTSSSTPPRNSNSNNVKASEGFVCPECRIVFNDQNLLQSHFIDAHSSNSSSSQISQSVPSPKNAGSFVCPQCFAELKDGDELQSHFSALHELSENRDGDVLAMRMELNDLRASIKEEKWYSVELKKELDKLHAKMQENIHAPTDSGDEMSYYLQQIQMLEAGKALVSTRMLEMEKQYGESQRACENLRRDKDRFMEKSANLSQDLASSMAQLDELTSQNHVISENLTKLQERVVDLEAQLDARPSEDDVAVLRKELIHAQTLMDQVSRENEMEASSWQIKCSQLENKCTEYEEIVKNLTQKMEKDDFEKLKQKEETTEENLIKVTDENKTLLEEILKYKSLLNETQEKLNESVSNSTRLSSEKSTLEEKMLTLWTNLKNSEELKTKHEKEFVDLRATISELQSTVESFSSNAESFKTETVREIDQKRKDIDRLTSKNEELTEGLSSTSAKYTELTKNYKNLEQSFDILKNERDEIERRRLDVENRLKNERIELERIQKSSESTNESHRENLQSMEKVRKHVEKLTDENKNLNEKLSEYIRKEQETSKIVDDLKLNVRNLESKCDESNHEIEKKLSKIKELENLHRKVSEEKENLWKEKNEMVEKLQAGEGVTTALQQLATEKTNLEQKVLRSDEELIQIKTKMNEKFDEYQQNIRQTNQKLKEEEDSRSKLELVIFADKDKIVKLEQNLADLNAKIQTREEQIFDLEHQLKENESKFNDISTKSKKSFDEICSEKESLVVDLDNHKRKIDDLQGVVDELRTKFESELQINNELNKKLGVFEARLNEKQEEMETGKKTFQDAKDILEKNLTEWKENFSRLNDEKEQLSSEIKSKNILLSDLTTFETELKRLLDQTTNECNVLQKELLGVRTELETSTNENEKFKKQIEELKSTNTEYSKRISDLNNQLNDREQIVVKQKEESSIAIKTSQQIVDELKAECLRLQEQYNLTIQNSQQESGELALLVTNMETTVDDLRKQIKSSEARENESQNVIQCLKNESEEMKSKFSSLNDEIATKQSLVDEFTSKIQELEKVLSDVRKNLEQKISDEEAVRNDVEELKKELESLRHSSKTEVNSKDDQIKILQTTVDDFTQKYEKLSDEHSETLTDLNEKKHSYADLDATRIQLESLLKDLQAEMDSELSKEKIKYQRLESEKVELTTKCCSFEKLVANLRENLSAKENDIQKLGESNETVKKDYEYECDSLRTQLNDLEREKHKMTKESSTKFAYLENTCREELESMKKELKIALIAKKDLEAQLTAWSEEKRMLLERCMNFEKYVEEEKDNGRELKRRLDDAISAMHELGRENQSMQIDMSKQFNRKWADDNEAVNCTACGKQFSLSIRKHHCRHCGLIFCNECSCKQYLVASSKKPVRVCDNCYNELNGR